jgi:hypothetical protein
LGLRGTILFDGWGQGSLNTGPRTSPGYTTRDVGLSVEARAREWLAITLWEFGQSILEKSGPYLGRLPRMSFPEAQTWWTAAKNCFRWRCHALTKTTKVNLRSTPVGPPSRFQVICIQLRIGSFSLGPIAGPPIFVATPLFIKRAKRALLIVRFLYVLLINSAY